MNTIHYEWMHECANALAVITCDDAFKNFDSLAINDICKSVISNYTNRVDIINPTAEICSRMWFNYWNHTTTITPTIGFVATYIEGYVEGVTTGIFN